MLGHRRVGFGVPEMDERVAGEAQVSIALKDADLRPAFVRVAVPLQIAGA